jgi:hypothetical protein
MAADTAFAQMRGEAAFGLLQEAFARAQEAGDDRMAAIVQADAAALAGRCPALFTTPLSHEQLLALVDQAKGLAPANDLEVAVHLSLAVAWCGSREPTRPTHREANEALERATEFGDPTLISCALDAAAASATDDGQFKDASRYSAQRLALLERLPRHDPKVGGEVADIYHMASESAVGAGELAAALASARHSFYDDASQGLPHFAATHLIPPLVLLGEFDEAVEQATVMRRGWERAGEPPAGWMAPSFFAAAFVHGLRGEDEEHVRWTALATSIAMKSPSSCEVYFRCRVALHNGALEQARSLATILPSVVSFGGLYDPYREGVQAETAVLTGLDDAGAHLATAQSRTLGNDFVVAQLLRAAGRLHHDETALKESVAAWEAIGARFERACTLVLLPDRVDEGNAELAALGCTPPAPGWW